jgi:hypothetical protein
MWGFVKQFIEKFKPRKLFKIAFEKDTLMQKCADLEGREFERFTFSN